jgi:RNA polymerase sigma factor (TIGR02999 family)
MRRILVERARQRRAARRGAGAHRVPLENVAPRAEERAAHLIALDEALERLATFDARKAQVVELKYFGGLTIDETADVVGVSTPTVEREWRAARLWLYREIRPEASR